MMRKVLLVCALVAVVAGTACAQDYYWYGTCSTDAGGNASATLFGRRTASTVKSDYSTTPTMNQGLLAVAEYTGNPLPEGNFVKTRALLVARLQVVPQNPPGVERWILLGFNETSYPETLGNNVRIWGANPLPTFGMDLYLLYNAASVPVAGLAPGAWGRVKLNTTPIIGTVTGSVTNPWFSYSLPIVKTNTPLTSPTYVFEFSRVGSPPIPEPGSMIAVLSGLVGLVGFGIRRKR